MCSKTVGDSISDIGSISCDDKSDDNDDCQGDK